MKILDTNEHVVRYEKEMQAARANFANNVKVLMEEKDPRDLLTFWLNFSSLGIGMTEPVEDWIRRAGEKTKALGYETLGTKLIKHAKHEKDHHLMMIEDTRNLAKIWNQKYAPPPIDANVLIKREAINSVRAYQELHEACINSNFAFAQIAIEYEIENLSVVHGPRIIQNSFTSLGNGIKSCLTFVCDHVEIDQAHTVYNKNAITEFAQEHPETVDKLIEVGSSALKIYANFLEDCYEYTSIFEKSALIA